MLSNAYKTIWLIRGDFNKVLCTFEKLGGNCINNDKTKLFWNRLQQYNLVDLGYMGSKFTLTNKRYKNCIYLIFEKLDRCVTNDSYIKRFPDFPSHLSPPNQV